MTPIIQRSLGAVLGFLAIAGSPTSQVPLTLGFDDLPLGTPVDGGYSQLGIAMPFAIVDTAPRPHSGSELARVTRRDSSGLIVLEMVFDSLQSSVSLYAETDAAGRTMVSGIAQGLVATVVS
jgi:hypothetical protein